MSTATPAVRTAGAGEVDAATLYRLLALRVAVFVVEQACPYPELDGRDLEPTTRHVWIDEGAGPVAYLRLLDEGERGSRIGRVCTAAHARGRGLAGRLIEHALARARPPTELSAQAHLEAYYARFGFVVSGPGYLEDGIPHVPMRRT